MPTIEKIVLEMKYLTRLSSKRMIIVIGTCLDQVLCPGIAE